MTGPRPVATAGRLPSGRRGLSREAVVHSQRERVLWAMIAAVDEDHYHAPSIVEVAACAGVSRKTVYELFGDKAGCFLAAHDSRIVVGGAAALMFERVAAGRASELPHLHPELLQLVLLPYLGPERVLKETQTAPGASQGRGPQRDERAGGGAGASIAQAMSIRSDTPIAAHVMSAADRGTGTRERLIRAAIDVIGEGGYAAAAVADVISRAGCSRGTFYEHFRGIEDCLLAAVDRVAQELVGRLTAATRDTHGLDVAHSFVRSLVGYAAEEPVSARVLLLEALGGGNRVLARRDRTIAEVERLIDDSSRRARGDRRVLALPTAALVGGTFRLLTIRLPRGTPNAEELESGLLGWIDAYLTFPGRHGSARRALAGIEPPADLERRTVRPPSPLAPGEQRSREEVARNQRERILHATIQAVYEYTYAGTTVADILAYASVSQRAFYSHFRDQEQAATAAKQLIFEHGMEAAAAAFFGGSDWPERVWAAGLALAYFNAANPAMARLAFVEFHAVPAAIGPSYDRVGAFTMFLEEGYSYREQNRELPRLCSDAIATVMFEVAYRTARRHPAAAELPTILPGLVYVALAPFLGPDQATDFVEAMTKRATLGEGGRADADPGP